ncbi:MAG: RrF2 family transcriptional regulator [Paracoccaceae bacterium]
MRVTKRTIIAIRLLMYCAANPDRLVTKSEVAGCCDISENHLAQVINQLSQAGYLETHRGRRGGFRLAVPAVDVSLGKVFRETEGSAPMVDCLAASERVCPLDDSCRLKQALSDAERAFYAVLNEVTLESLISGPDDILQMFIPVACTGDV